jgi:hypothetical protein
MPCCSSAHVLGQIAARQDAAVHLRVQRLHAAIEHLREAGVIGHFGHGQAGVGQQFGGAAGRQQLDAEADSASRSRRCRSCRKRK